MWPGLGQVLGQMVMWMRLRLMLLATGLALLEVLCMPLGRVDAAKLL